MTARVAAFVPFLHVTDMARSLRFWVDGLGFTIALRWEPDGVLRWCRLERDGAALMLQSFLDDDGHDRRPAERLGVGFSIVLPCDDAIALHDELVTRGVTPRREPRVGNGLWMVQLADPDGYVVELSSETDVPEETTLSAWRATRP